MAEMPSFNKVDRETWLSMFVPGALLTMALYVGIPNLQASVRHWGEGLGTTAEAVILIFFGLVLIAALGVLSSLSSRFFDRVMWPYRWLKLILGERIYEPRAWVVAQVWFGGEILPYSSLIAVFRGDERTYGVVPEMTVKLKDKIQQLTGPQGGIPDKVPELLRQTVRRMYNDIASDVVKAWVLARVGRTVSREAWEYASGFRHFDNAYRSLSVAAPLSLIILALPPLMTLTSQLLGHLGSSNLLLFLVYIVLIAEGVLVFFMAMMVAWFCQVQALVNWIQWQNELCRIFYVTAITNDTNQNA